MSSRLIATATLLAVFGIAGCTNVQKGTAVGGGIGSVVGAAVGTSTSLRGGPGGLIGLGIGGLAGAIAADYYYDDTDTELAQVPDEELERLKRRLEESHAREDELQDELERERAQQLALLEAHQKARSELEALREGLSGQKVLVTQEANDEITFTILSEVLFDSGKATLTRKGKQALARAAAVIREQFPDANVEIRGHTDNVPIRYSNFKSNWELSCHRALAVLHYLVENEGFEAERLTPVGCGETRPVASNDTPEGRRLNRRAEIVVRPRDLKVVEQKLTVR